MKNVIKIFVIICGMFVVTGLFVPGVCAAENVQADNNVIDKNGLYTDEAGNRYYYKNGSPVKNQVVVIPETVNGIKKNYYYGFDSYGIMYKNRKVVIAGKTYYFKADGKAATGFYKIGNELYYFYSNGVLAKGRWLIINRNRYYANKKGVCVTGLKRISGYTFYFSKAGVMQKNRWITAGDDRYYLGSKGKAYTGLRKIGKYYYYFRSNTKLVRNKWVTISKKRYYFGSNGRAYTGPKKVNGSKFYYNFSKKGYLKSGIVKIKGVKYRFGNNGKPLGGWYRNKKGTYYYFRENGAMVKNRSYMADGALYLFSRGGVRYVTSGFKTVNGKYYYVMKNGTLATGYKEIDGDYYYFSKNGVMYRKKWAYVDGYKFYFDIYGRRLTDVDEVLGHQDSYLIKVNKMKNVITVYAEDGSRGYTIPVKAFVCSTGAATPTGTFYTPSKYRWLTLMGPCWGQWCTQIYADFLFHSVYYNVENNNNALSVSAYNQLGTTCSHGCVRLTAGDAKWIYDNCSLRTQVVIYNSDDEGPFPKPSAAKLSYWHTWDPTDPNMSYKCKANNCNH